MPFSSYVRVDEVMKCNPRILLIEWIQLSLSKIPGNGLVSSLCKVNGIEVQLFIISNDRTHQSHLLGYS